MYCGFRKNQELDATRCVASNGNDCQAPMGGFCPSNEPDCNLVYYCKSVSDPNQVQYFQTGGKGDPECPPYYMGPFPMSNCPQTQPPQPPQPVQRINCTPNVGMGVLLDTVDGDCGSQEVDQYGEERSLRDMQMLRNFGCRR
jgi:hypothetical protein